MELHVISPDTCVLRDTASRKGRSFAIAPGQTAASRHLHYGRVILDTGDAPITIDTGERETGLIGLRGSATATIDGQSHTINRYDALYVPRGSRVTVQPSPPGCTV